MRRSEFMEVGLSASDTYEKSMEENREIAMALIKAFRDMVSPIGGENNADDAVVWESILSASMRGSLRISVSAGADLFYVRMEPFTDGVSIGVSETIFKPKGHWP